MAGRMNLIGTWDPGYAVQQVVGEGHHKKELSQLARRYGGGAKELEVRVVAVLAPEPRNPHDRNAVAVLIDQLLVGYLPREDAAGYSAVLGPLAAAGCQLSVPARLWWGSDKGDFYASVTLNLPPAGLLFSVNRLPDGSALLPTTWSAKVSGTADHLDVLVPYLGGRPEVLVFATLAKVSVSTARTTKDLVEVLLDGHPIGRFTPATSNALMPVVDLSQRSGRPLAAYATVKGNQLQVDVSLRAQKAADLPADWLGANFPGTISQPTSSPIVQPANWYADPQDPTQWRYWDGVQWTEHTSRSTRP